MTVDFDNKLMSPEEVAEACGLSRRAVYRAIERGELPASRLCSRLRIRRNDLDVWIDVSRVEPAPRQEWRRPLTQTPVGAPPSNGLQRLLRSGSPGAST